MSGQGSPENATITCWDTMDDQTLRDREVEIARTARRSASNEAGLLWALLGSALSVGLVFYNPLHYLLGGGLFMAAFTGFFFAGVAAYFWYKIEGAKIAEARQDFNDILRIKSEMQNKIHLHTLRQRVQDTD